MDKQNLTSRSKKLVVFDGNAIMHRAFHAIPPLTTKNGEPINAIYGLVSMLINVIDTLKPTHVIVCFDEKAKTFRQKLLPTYQSQRPQTANELSSQFGKARDFLKASKIPVYSVPGFEADDVIGTLSSKATEKSDFDEVIVVTGDRDMLQLVDDIKHIMLYMPIGGLSNGKIFGEKETIERLGVAPNKIIDYKALVGDASDNYFGVVGIGPKTAINLLSEFKKFDEIYNNLDKIPAKLKEKLEKGKESAKLSYKLATIVKDVPLRLNFEDSSKWDLAADDVLELFSKFGFRTLSDRIKKLGEKIKSEKQGSLF